MSLTDHLLGELSSLGNSVAFCHDDVHDPVLPGLEIEGVGPVSLPITPEVAQRMIAKAQRAPHGYGEETVLDLEVRRTWQLSPSVIHLRNPAWRTFLDRVVAGVSSSFGIERQVKADLHKLLIYEPGDFFKPHRDSEKSDTMFATLVICLPSHFEGGVLKVSHAGETKAIQLGGERSRFQLQHAAFYADCEHEVTPVTEGYRICLVYNLSLADGEQLSAPDMQRPAARLHRPLSAWFEEHAVLAVPLSFQYSAAGLAPSMLKGEDQMMLHVLQQAAQDLDCAINLALLTCYQSGEVDYESIDYGYHRRSEPDFECATMGDVVEESITLDNWIGADGAARNYGKLRLEFTDILTEMEYEDIFDEQEVTEATGNEGVSMERWYRQGVIVMWPNARHFQMLSSSGQHGAIGALEDLLQRAGNKEQLAACVEFATAIVDQWRASGRYGYHENSVARRMLSLLQKLEVPELATYFMLSAFIKDYDGTEGPTIAAMAERHGWQLFRAPLITWLKAQKPDIPSARLVSVARIIGEVCTAEHAHDADRQRVCRELAEALMALVEAWDAQPPVQYRLNDRKDLPAHLLSACAAGKVEAIAQRFLDHALGKPELYGMHLVLIPALSSLHAIRGGDVVQVPGYGRLRDACIDHLAKLTAEAPKPPADHSRHVSETGCSCAVCKDLAAFLRAPDRREHRIAARQSLRQHVESEIRSRQYDIDCTTIRQGSPHALKLTKNLASYHRACKFYELNMQLIEQLRQFP